MTLGTRHVIFTTVLAGLARIIFDPPLCNQRAFWMIALTSDLDVLAPGVTTRLTAIFFSVSNFAKTRYVRAFRIFLVRHGRSSD
jgi:hypothetical protein